MNSKTIQTRDIYYQGAKEKGFRARSSYKLIQLNSKYKIFENVKNAVDLCASPGSWSQVMEIENISKIVAVDIQPISPIKGVEIIQGDITKYETVEKIFSKFKENEKAQLVVSDGAGDLTGLHDLDCFTQSQLVISALKIALFLLEDGGTFIVKFFIGRDTHILEMQLDLFFDSIEISKPDSSRIGSTEAFFVCKGFKLPEDFKPSFEPQNNRISKFLECGDLSGFDEDFEF